MKKAKKQDLRYKKDSDSFGHEVKHPHLLTLMTTNQLKRQSKRQKGYNTAVNFRKEMVGLHYE